jgi:hypothetical protein
MSGKTMLGAFVGGNAPGNEQTLHDLATALGHPVDYAVAFLNHTSWDAFDKSVPYTLSQWPASEKLLVSVPLTVEGTDLATVASGAEDRHFVAAAKAIAAHDPNAIIRPGWEMNLDIFPWAAAHNPDAYVHAYQHLVDAFRSVSSGFTFDWTPNIGTNSVDPAKVYPGDKYVDTIGMDLNIDRQYSGGQSDDRVWDNLVHQSNGLQWQADFAAAHGKPMSYPEWATDYNDGTMIQHMAQWIGTHNVAHQSYWDSNENVSAYLPQHSTDQQAYVQAFGVHGDWWTG